MLPSARRLVNWIRDETFKSKFKYLGITLDKRLWRSNNPQTFPLSVYDYITSTLQPRVDIEPVLPKCIVITG